MGLVIMERCILFIHSIDTILSRFTWYDGFK